MGSPVNPVIRGLMQGFSLGDMLRRAARDQAMQERLERQIQLAEERAKREQAAAETRTRVQLTGAGFREMSEFERALAEAGPPPDVEGAGTLPKQRRPEILQGIFGRDYIRDPEEIERQKSARILEEAKARGRGTAEGRLQAEREDVEAGGMTLPPGVQGAGQKVRPHDYAPIIQAEVKRKVVEQVKPVPTNESLIQVRTGDAIELRGQKSGKLVERIPIAQGPDKPKGLTPGQAEVKARFEARRIERLQKEHDTVDSREQTIWAEVAKLQEQITRGTFTNREGDEERYSPAEIEDKRAEVTAKRKRIGALQRQKANLLRQMGHDPADFNLGEIQGKAGGPPKAEAAKKDDPLGIR